MLARPVAFLILAGVLFGAPDSSAKRPLNLDDLGRLHDVAAPELSPDGRWVAYTVSSTDSKADKRVTHIWMANWEGTEELQLTNGQESESSPRWSPDGKYLSFVSSRAGETKGSQIWLLNRQGGEAHQLTHFKNYEISEYDWSPDSSKLALVLRERDEPEKEEPKPGAAPENPKPPKPIVIDRYHFKQDIVGYLNRKYNHIYLFDVATEKLEQITNGGFDETDARWSPDGSKIAFISNGDQDPDRTENTDVFVVDAKPHATPLRLTTYPGPDSGHPVWSPDGRSIAYLQGSEPKFTAYGMERLALVPTAGGNPKILTEKLDRGVSAAAFSQNGSALIFLVADDRSEYPAQVRVSGGAVEPLLRQPLIGSALTSKAGHTAILVSTDKAAPEVYALESGGIRQLSHQNDKLFAELDLGAVEDIGFKSSDGTEVHGLVTKPVHFEAGRKYPTLLRIHGGPNGQDGHAFSYEHQLFAAHGYVVISVNYRGSAGRGHKYGESIFADWGHHEVADLLAGVDQVESTGIADPERLGIGGWSYGGILTDYTIASDGRFKAAISGAGSANQISMYGIDQYVFQYDNEIGPPWKNEAAWIKLSYPFFHADRIHTPTLFMGGEKDFNVPLAGGEQMYQALQTLHVPTELVVYPGQFHGFTRPSFIRDRYERYLAWYGKYLHPANGKPMSASLK
jgi:dipeptidyl aminopeptidase/acylaminoacyl peptidase